MTTTIPAKTVAKQGQLHFRDAAPLIRAISNCLLFAGTDNTLPMLTVVRFEFDGKILRTAATDRYRLCVEPVDLKPDIDHTNEVPFDFLLQRVIALAILGVLKKNRLEPIRLTFDAETGSLCLETTSTTSTYLTDRDHQFPPYKPIIPDLADTVAVSRIAFSAKYLSDLGKVTTRDKNPIVAINIFGPTKASLIQFLDGPLVVVMPFRADKQ